MGERYLKLRTAVIVAVIAVLTFSVVPPDAARLFRGFSQDFEARGRSGGAAGRHRLFGSMPAMMPGIVIGTYSSASVAGPIVMSWHRKSGVNH